MNKYEGKTEEEAVSKACADLGVEDPSTLSYQVISVKKTLFSKTVTIGIYSINDVIVFADDYIKRCLHALGIEGSTEAKYEDGVIKLNIVTSRNKNVIGRNGDTLRSINELTRSACFNRFGGHYRILLNCDGYKETKYSKFAMVARRYARDVQVTHQTVILDPMTSDERRIIHQALSDMPNIKTQSLGTGHKRHVTIQYVPDGVTVPADEENK
jgi:spoIIIJ-associated protein